MRRLMNILLCVAAATLAGKASAQASVVVHLQQPAHKMKEYAPAPEALLWLDPIDVDVHAIAWPGRPPYRLLQKNKMFTPHLLVVPVGTSVAFPNADPFFHNVFSLFDGSRFDLGLYEAGSTRFVRFSRKGFSFIFCNIHPEMAAVVVALDTPLWASGAGTDTLTIADVPVGRYHVHIWMEGQETQQSDRWTHDLTVAPQGIIDAGSFTPSAVKTTPHLNEFHQPYSPAYSPY